MSAFMRNWVPQEHQLRQEVTATMESIKNWIDLDYKQDIETFLKHAVCDRKLRKQLSGAKKCVKTQLKVEQNKNFDALKETYEHLKLRMEAVTDGATHDCDLIKFVELERQLLDYLNHWTPRIHTQKPQIGKNLQTAGPNKPSKSSVKRFHKEREEKRKVQRQFIDAASDDPFDDDELFKLGAVGNMPFAHCA